GQPKEPLSLRGPEFSDGELIFSPDGRTLWAIGRFGVAWRWEFDGTTVGAWPRTSPDFGTEVHSVAYAHRGEWLGAVTDDGRLHFMTVDLKRVLTLPGHDRATALAFSADDRWLATIGYDGKVNVWEVSALASHFGPTPGGEPRPRHVLATGNTRTLFARKIGWHPRGRLYATSGDGLLFDWDFTQPDPAATVRSHRLHSIDYMLNAVAVSPDGHWLAVGRHGWDDRPAAGSTQFGNLVLLFDVSDPGTLRFVVQLRCNHLAFGALAFSPDSRWLACGAERKPVLVWDLAAKNIESSVREAPFSGVTFEALAFSPDGRTLALAGWDGRVHLWPFLGSSIANRSLRLPKGVRSCAFTPDGRRIVMGGVSGRVLLWDLDLETLLESARRIAGRDFTENERQRFDLSTGP
ncbi:MAG: WD40 repeat domain-containing protein, partial [Phycisphaerales bacterium]|nr:WD40 repeat domain-containing protein [Phycisphaerales bacterium]